MTRTAILLTTIWLICGIGCAQAGPIQLELKTSKCLVSDSLISNGGSSPALSPDGTVLVYKTEQPEGYGEDRIWVLNDTDRQFKQPKSGIPVQPWELVIKNQQPATVGIPFPSMGEYRNVDWSPDGTKVVFSCNGRIYVAELSDLKAKQSNARLLCGVIYADSGSRNSPLVAPRWSPDGKQVAFVWTGNIDGPFCHIYVVDVATGEKRVIAKDAIWSAQVWEQPWSPDGKHITYSSLPAIKIENGLQNFSVGGISVASFGSEGTVRINNESLVLCPSWSPIENRIAYISPSCEESFSAANTMIYICDINGKKPVVVGKPSYPKGLITSAQDQTKSILLKILKEDYPGIFSPTQLQMLSKLKITTDRGASLLYMAQCALVGELEGGEFAQQIMTAMKQLPVNMKNIEEVCKTVTRVYETLPEEKRKSIDNAVNTRFIEIVKPLLKLHSNADRSPIWSPDGKRIAYIRANVFDGTSKLMIADLKTGKTRTVFESGSIGTISWSKDGKLLLLQARQGLAHTTNPDAGFMDFAMDQLSESTSTSSYPEIWLIELK